MRTSAIHIALRAVLLCAFGVYSMGITTVVKYCSMSDSSECCCAPLHSGPGVGGTRQLSVDGETPTCFSITVLGGLHDTKATITSDYSPKSLVVDATVSGDAISGLTLPDHVSVPHVFDDHAPPAVEIFLLTGSLLI